MIGSYLFGDYVRGWGEEFLRIFGISFVMYFFFFKLVMLIMFF